jgi:hypothetical protein
MRSLPLAVFVALLLVPEPAGAGEAESRTLFAEGRLLREEGKCGDAIVLFKKSLETYPEGLGAMRNIAECEEELGRLASARRTWRDLRLAVQRSGEARYEGWDRDAEEAQRRLAPRVPKLMIVLQGEGRISVNGRPFDPRLLGVELEQDLGPLEVLLEDGSAVPEKKSLVMEEGGRYKLELRARKAAAGAPAGSGRPVGPAPVEDAEQGPSGLLVGGAVSLSVGGAALVGMGIAIGVYQSALSEVESNCPGYEQTDTCNVDVSDAADRGTASALAVNVLAPIGGVGVATGIVLLVVDATREKSAPHDQETGRIRPAFAPLPGGGFVGLSGSF